MRASGRNPGRLVVVALAIGIATVGVGGDGQPGGRMVRLEAEGGEIAGRLQMDPGAGLVFRPADGTAVVPLETAAGLRLILQEMEAVGGVGLDVHRGPAGDWRVAQIEPDGPAAGSAAVRPGDVLAAVAEPAGPAIQTTGLEREAVQALLRGRPGSAVRLVVGDPPAGDGVPVPLRDLTLVRTVAGCGDLAGADPRDALDKSLALQAELARRQGANPPALLHLRTGDAVDIELVGGDAAGLQVRLPGGEDRQVPAAAVRAVELAAATARPIARRKLERLLTVPRAQAADPPRHVLRMASGDYVRGRIVGIDREVVCMSVLGVEQRFARRLVARIIWLASAAEPGVSIRERLAALPGTPMRLLGPGGRRLSLAAAALEGDVLIGTSPDLGPLRVDLAGCSEMLVAAGIDAAAPAEPAFSRWVLPPP